MKFISWNLEKKDLVPWALQTFKPDVALFQEWVGNPTTDTNAYYRTSGLSFKEKGYPVGTSIYSLENFSEVKTVLSPFKDNRAKFWLGKIQKATTIATLDSGLTVVSFHGYNGWSLFGGHDPKKLIAHIEAVLKEIATTVPVVFAGDFNTFTAEHLDMVATVMYKNAFVKQVSEPYDTKKTLDHVYTRDCKFNMLDSSHHESDHPYMVFEITR